MTGTSHPEDALTPAEREELEADLISLCERELDLLGDVWGLRILYAGGSSLLWVEGLSQRIGEDGSLTALDLDAERVGRAREGLEEADLAAPLRLVVGDVFEPPFPPGAFDLVYSAGLLHELDVGERTAREALAALASVVRPGGRVATSDFVDSEPAAQLEDEALRAELARRALGAKPYGIGSPERLVDLHREVLDGVRWKISLPYPIRHLDKLVLAEGEPEDPALLPDDVRLDAHGRRAALLELVRREGYTRPATLYVEGVVSCG